MKTIKLKNATLELSAEDIAELRKQLEEPAWPEYGDDYYYWDADDGTIGSERWDDEREDKERLERGEIFRTKEECEEDDKKRRALVRIKDFIRKEGLEYTPNWKAKAEHKHFIRYDHDKEAFETEWYWHVNNLLTPFYFKSEGEAHKVIDNCEADLKILFNINP